MRTPVKITIASAGLVLAATGLLVSGGCLSAPREVSSPSTVIRVVDESGFPMDGIEISRYWYDSDCNTEGSERKMTDRTGKSEFGKIPARVGLFTGAWRKTFSHLGMCASGSGTRTEVYVRYRGSYDAVPLGKALHPVGKSFHDPNGVWFLTSSDRLSNTLVELTFLGQTESIDYAISSKRKPD